MNRSFQDVILQATGAGSLYHIEDIQSLWSGYGKIVRYGLRGGDRERVVVKPNVGWERRPEQAADTDPRVVGAVVRACREAGASSAA